MLHNVHASSSDGRNVAPRSNQGTRGSGQQKQPHAGQKAAGEKLAHCTGSEVAHGELAAQKRQPRQLHRLQVLPPPPLLLLLLLPVVPPRLASAAAGRRHQQPWQAALPPRPPPPATQQAAPSTAAAPAAAAKRCPPLLPQLLRDGPAQLPGPPQPHRGCRSAGRPAADPAPRGGRPLQPASGCRPR